MSRWFRFYDDTINDPTLQRLHGDKFKAWINLLCITSKHDGVLPSLTDLAFLLRPMGEDKIAALIEEFCEKGLIVEVSTSQATSYAPKDWASRQYTDVTAAERAKRYRDGKRDATRDGHGGNGDVTRLEQKEKKRTDAVTATFEVTDPDALAAWDEYGRQTTGKGYPRNSRGGWCFPSLWPPSGQTLEGQATVLPLRRQS
jgi:hypothetical protein